MKPITRQTCYKMKVNSYLCYHNYCKSERQKERCEEGVHARAEENVSGDQESTEQCITIPFIHKNNQSDQIFTQWGMRAIR